MNRRKFLRNTAGLFVPAACGLLVPRVGAQVFGGNVSVGGNESIGPTAAGGGGGGWTPASLTNLVLWLRASDEVGSDGTALGTLTDRSGNAHDFTQATGANKPILKLSQVNGKSAYQFDGSRIASCATFLMGTSAKFTVFIVIKYASTATCEIFERSTNSNDPITTGFVFTTNATSNSSIWYNGAGGYSEFKSSVTLDTSNWHRIIARGDKTLSTNETTMDYDGTTGGSYPNNFNTSNDFNTTQAMFIGARSGLADAFNGYIAEIAVTSTTNSSDETSWKAYVLSQYGI